MKIGILGNGQLATMLALAGLPLGFEFIFYSESQSTSPLLGRELCYSYQNIDALMEFATYCDVITYENENIPVDSLQFLEKMATVFPGSLALQNTQDRFIEKNFINALSIQTAPYARTDAKKDLLNFIDQHNFPVIMKSRKCGYDGKGQVIIQSINDLKNLSDSDCRNSIVEKMVEFNREISIIGVRNSSGAIACYDICENVHRNGVLAKTYNRVNDPKFLEAKTIITKIMNHLNYVGTMTVEFFECEGNLIVNEIAPRVHNSGHWTLQGTLCSQFENHLRAICNLPLGDTSSIALLELNNILSVKPNLNTLLNADCVAFDYKKTPKPNRKLGHYCKLLSKIAV